MWEKIKWAGKEAIGFDPDNHRGGSKELFESKQAQEQPIQILILDKISTVWKMPAINIDSIVDCNWIQFVYSSTDQILFSKAILPLLWNNPTFKISSLNLFHDLS